MKKFSLFLGTLLLGVSMHAGSYVTSTTTFRTDPLNNNIEFELDHHYAYTWGITSAANGSQNTYTGLKDQLKVGTGWEVVSVKVTFEDIWDWVKEDNDRLWLTLVDTDFKGGSGKDLKKGVTEYSDNADDIESADPGKNYFKNDKTKVIGYWTDPKGGNKNDAINVTFTFNSTQISSLVAYINNGGATGSNAGNYADFGLAFDPDCHYYNTGIKLEVVTKKYYVPDGGASVALLGAGVLTVAALRRRFIR